MEKRKSLTSRRYSGTLVLMLSLMLLTVGWLIPGNLQAASDKATDTLTIGLVGTFTGPSAALGIPLKWGWQIAMDEYNEKYGGLPVGDKIYKLEAIIYDDHGDAKQEITIAKRLVERDNVKYVIGFLNFPDAAQAITDPAKVITFEPASVQMADHTKYGFRANDVPSDEIWALLNYGTKVRGAKKIAYIGDSGTYCEAHRQAIKYFAKELGYEYGPLQTYEWGEQNFAPMIAKVKHYDPDLFIMGGWRQDDMIMVMKASREQGLDCILGLNDMYAIKGFAKQFGKELLYFVNKKGAFAFTPDVNEFDPPPNRVWYNEQLKKKFGEQPNPFDLMAYDTLMVLFRAIQKAGTIDTEEVRKAIYTVKYDGVRGPGQYFTIEPDHIEGKKFHLKETIVTIDKDLNPQPTGILYEMPYPRY